MDLEGAKESFITLLNSIQDSKKSDFLKWAQSFVRKEYDSNSITKNGTHASHEGKQKEEKADILLSCIKSILKQKIPFNGVMNSEQINFPVVGADVNLNDKNCVHVDAFLYDEDDVDLLIESGKISNNYCKDCNSTNIQAMTFISHSASKDRLKYIFRNCLPSMKGKVFLDIGSRLGVVLYTAYVYSEASKITGVEMNHELCNLQNDIIDKYKFNDRIVVLEGDIMGMPAVVKEADVIVLNNVFEWFFNLKDQVNIWKFLFLYIKSGTIIVATPPIETTLELINSDIVFKTWLKEIDVGVMTDDFIEETELRIYKVL